MAALPCLPPRQDLEYLLLHLILLLTHPSLAHSGPLQGVFGPVVSLFSPSLPLFSGTPPRGLPDMFELFLTYGADCFCLGGGEVTLDHSRMHWRQY